MADQLALGGLEELQKENERLKVLLHLAQNLQANLELDRLLFTTMQEVAKIMDADRCSVFLLDEQKNELWSIVAMGIDEEGEIRFPADKGIAGYVASTGEILNIPDAYTDPRFNPQIDKKTGYRTQNLLTMPLSNKSDEIIGVVQVLNKRSGSFSQNDEELLNAISQIAATTIENSLLYEEQVESLNSFIETLSATLDTRDYITAGHSKRVTLYALALCDQLLLEKSSCEQLRYAGLLHDIGKLSIPESILFKGGKLTEVEYKVIKNHPAVTRQILEKIHFPRNLRLVPDIASTHHEKVNGKGYPDGLKDEEIPLGGKLLALADVFDALTSKRQYRDREPIEKVWSIIENENGNSFDPLIVDVFLQISLKKIIKIMEFNQQEKMDNSELNLLSEIPFQKILEITRNSELKLNIEDKSILQIFNKYYWRKYL
jgi:putative nucleotidyltransferase with HDIG domain